MIDRNEAFNRVRMMAGGKNKDTWDLSDNDEESLRIVLAEHDRLAAECKRYHQALREIAERFSPDPWAPLGYRLDASLAADVARDALRSLEKA